MELFEYHFKQLSGNLIYHPDTDTHEMFSPKSGIRRHINYLTFKRLFEEMKDLKNPLILESGIASAGTQSTYLFDSYVKKYGGFFWSVDINRNLVENHKGNMCPATQLICDDSISFFKQWASTHDKADVIYLDSWDLDFYDPIPAGNHGLAEYNALKPVIKKDTLLLVDDTPISPSWLDSREEKFYNNMNNYYKKNNNRMPGKGMFIIDEIKNANLLLHNYQLLYKFNNSPIL
jgi:hypothetical protein